MNFKLLTLRMLASWMANYRQGPARPAIAVGKSTQSRIAVVKLDAIGDFVLATTFLQVLLEELPAAEITLFCRKPVGELARQQFPGWTIVELPPRRSTLQNVLLDRTTRRQLKSQPLFDLLIDLRTYRDFSDTVLASWISARHKLALQNTLYPINAQVCLPSEEQIYDQMLPLPDYSQSPDIRDLQHYRFLVAYLFPLREHTKVMLPKLRITESDQRVLVQQLTSKRVTSSFLLLCPGARAPIREYPPAQLAQAVVLTMKKHALPVVIAGSREDRAIAADLNAALQTAGVNPVNLTGDLNLTEHLALVSLARAVICMETSHAHIAGALGRPAVAIIGGGHYGLFAPWGESRTFRWLTHRVPCFGCNWKCIYDHPLCIHDILPNEIAKNLADILSLSAGEKN